MPSITPSLWFDNNLEEAAQFYTSIFPNSRIETFERYTEAGPGTPGDVVSGTFVLDGTRFIGINGGPQFPFTEAVSFLVECKDQDEVDYYWDRLVDGGEESQCGWLKDRFGLSWQIVPTRLFELTGDPDPARAAAATKAMLGMRKIIIAELEDAVATLTAQLVRRSIHSIVASVIGPTSAGSSHRITIRDASAITSMRMRVSS